jgi:hypothetical protein
MAMSSDVPGASLITWYQPAGLGGEQAKQLERLRLQTDLTTVLEQTFGLEIELEGAKAQDRWPGGTAHKDLPAVARGRRRELSLSLSGLARCSGNESCR